MSAAVHCACFHIGEWTFAYNVYGIRNIISLRRLGLFVFAVGFGFGGEAREMREHNRQMIKCALGIKYTHEHDKMCLGPASSVAAAVQHSKLNTHGAYL